MQLKRLTSLCDLFLLNVILILFKVFGAAPFAVSINSDSRNKKGISLKISQSIAGAVYNFLLSLVFIMMIVYKVYSPDKSNEKDDSPLLFTLINVYVVIAQVMIAMIVIIFAINQQKLIVSINKLLHTNRLLKKILGDTYHFEIKKFLFVLLILHYSIFVSTTFLISIFENYYDRLLLNITHFAIANVMLQYVILFTYIQKVYHSINSHLLSFAKCQQDPMDGSGVPSRHCCVNSNTARNKIIFCRKMQSTLGEISHEFSEFFSWPILFAICISCINLVYNTYQLVIYVVLDKKEFPVESVYWFLRCLNITFQFVIVTGCINDLFSEIKRTSDIIYQLMSVYSEKSKVMFELEQFSMELLHRKQIEFTACGLFSLDRSLLASGSRIMFTYMILLIQAHFDRGLFTSNNPNNLPALNITTPVPTVRSENIYLDEDLKNSNVSLT